MCTQYLYHIHPLALFPHLLFPSYWYQSSPPPTGRACSTLLFSNFAKKKKKGKRNYIFVCLR
jgi:hypothetical protein